MLTTTMDRRWNTSKYPSDTLAVFINITLIHREVQTFPNFFAAYTYVVGLLVFGTAFFLPPLHYILNKYVLPQPGEGPSEAFMDTGFLKVDGYAVGSNGSKVKTMIYFPTDPGYRDTVSDHSISID